MNRMSLLVAGMACLCAIVVAQARQETKQDKPFSDKEFVQKAASGGMTEVMLGKIAESKGSEAVKKFGERMVTDHTKLNASLMKAAQAAGIPVPEKLNEHDQAEVEMFKNYKGTDFDQAYIKHMLADHEQDIALFKRASKEAKNPAIREAATEALPVIETHLELAKKLAEMVKQ